MEPAIEFGLILSGGGVRGIAHIGVLKVLEDLGMKPGIISGSSAGALVGALHAGGYHAEEILEIAKRTKLFGLPKVGRPGLFGMNGFETAILKYIPENTFESLSIPLCVAATDIVKGESVYFSQGTLSAPLMASACVPLIFPPMKYQGTLFVDGGILDNFPIQPLINRVDTIVGSHVNSLSKRMEHIHLRNIVDRSVHFALSQSVYSKSGMCSVFIDPPDMSRFGIFDLKRADEIYQYGLEHASKFRDQLMGLTAHAGSS